MDSRFDKMQLNDSGGGRIELRISILIVTTFFCIFAVPNSISVMGNSVAKLLFILVCPLAVLLSVKSSSALRVSIWDAIFFELVLVMAVIATSADYFVLLTPMFICKLIRREDFSAISALATNSVLLFVCTVAVIIYSVLFGTSSSWVITSILEVNQSGLAVFCLGNIVRTKNKTLGTIILLAGCLTWSRNYYLVLAIEIIAWLYLRKREGRFLVAKFNFFSLTVISTILLILIGILFMALYSEGQISVVSYGSARIFDIIDYSNYNRFSNNIYVLKLFIENPGYLLTGIDYDTYCSLCTQIAAEMNQVFRAVAPHNFFFSYLRQYGILGIFSFVYVNKVLKMTVSRENYGIFIGIMCYSFFTSIGLNIYWLSLTMITLIVTGSYSRKEYPFYQQEKGELPCSGIKMRLRKKPF